MNHRAAPSSPALPGTRFGNVLASSFVSAAAAAGSNDGGSAGTWRDPGRDTVDANVALGLPVDSRDYGMGAQILADLGLSTIRLLTNNPKKIVGLEGYGLRVTDQLPLAHAPTEHNREYLRAKRDRLGHLLHHQGLALDEEMIHEERVQDRARERRAQRDPERQREPRG